MFYHITISLLLVALSCNYTPNENSNQAEMNKQFDSVDFEKKLAYEGELFIWSSTMVIKVILKLL